MSQCREPGTEYDLLLDSAEVFKIVTQIIVTFNFHYQPFISEESNLLELDNNNQSSEVEKQC